MRGLRLTYSESACTICPSERFLALRGVCSGAEAHCRVAFEMVDFDDRYCDDVLDAAILILAHWMTNQIILL